MARILFDIGGSNNFLQRGFPGLRAGSDAYDIDVNIMIIISFLQLNLAKNTEKDQS